MIKALKDARWNYLWVFAMCACFFADIGTCGFYFWPAWTIAIAMVFESFVLAMALAENEDAK